MNNKDKFHQISGRLICQVLSHAFYSQFYIFNILSKELQNFSCSLWNVALLEMKYFYWDQNKKLL